jgi:hypothetical protein
MIIEHNSAAPKGKALERLAAHSRDTVSKMALAVVVAEGNSFRRSFARAGTIALARLFPHQVPYRVVETVDAAIAELTPYVPAALGATPDDLRAAISSLRRQFAAASVVSR